MIAIVTAARLPRGDPERLDAADVGAGDPDVLAAERRTRRRRRSRAPGIPGAATSSSPGRVMHRHGDRHHDERQRDERRAASRSGGHRRSWSSRAPTAAPSRRGWPGPRSPGSGCGRRAARRSAGTGTGSCSWLLESSLNGKSDRLGAHVVPVGVVVGARLADVGERGDDVGRVLAQVVDLVLGVVELLDQLRERRGGDPGQRRGSPAASEVRSPPPDGLWIRSSSCADRRDRRPRAPCAARQGTPAAGGRPAWTPRPAGPARPASSRGPRRSVVERVQRPGQQRERLLQRLALAGDRAGRGARVGDQLAQLVAARGQRAASRRRPGRRARRRSAGRA